MAADVRLMLMQLLLCAVELKSLSISAASMRSSKLWLDAISQNAWDTGNCQLKIKTLKSTGWLAIHMTA